MRLAALAASLALIATAAHAQEPAGSFAGAMTEADAGFRAFQDSAHVPGMVWGVVQDGRIVHFGASGVQDLQRRQPVGRTTLFRIASMSKAFTALAILKLRDEGRLSLDAPVAEYVPELRNWRYPTSDSAPIRVRDLLSHVGGFVTDDPWGDRQQPMSEAAFTQMLAEGVPFTRAPQTQFEYSNFGYALLGRIVTNVSGRPYDQYIMAEIMRPLGMNDTRYEVRDAPRERTAVGYRWENDRWTAEPVMPHGVFGAMGGVQTSAEDYSRWIAFLLSAWPARDGDDAGPVRRSTVREMAHGLNFISTAQRPRGEEMCTIASAYGMGLRVLQDCALGLVLTHGGGYPGYGSTMILLPEQGVGIFAFANRTYAGPAPPATAALQAMHDAGLLTGRAWPVSDALANAYRAAGAMYAAGDLAPGRDALAMNFLMDRSAENWRREFARLKGEVGECQTDAPITATGALAGRIAWTCERGTIAGTLLLAPTNPPGIQALRLNARRAE